MMIRKNLVETNSFFRIAICLLCIVVGLHPLHAQTFVTKDVALYDYMGSYYVQEIPIEVSGLPDTINRHFGLESVEITLHHKRTSDLKISLRAPDGTTAWVTNRNGNSGDYIQSVFSQYGKEGRVNAGDNPFTGNYIPDGNFVYFNNGQDPNGTWYLRVEDLKRGIKGFLDTVKITFSNNPARIKERKVCSFEHPEYCTTNGESSQLLPDLVIVPFFTETQYKEYAKDDSIYSSQLKVSVAIANIGLGPLEVYPESLDSFTVMNGKKEYQLLQRVYSLEDGHFTSVSKEAGRLFYDDDPGHNHYHAANWIEMRLVKIEGGKREVMAQGGKVTYCLFTNGMLYEKDKSSIINGIQYGHNLKNYGLGNYPACGLSKQGITVGGYDYYGMMYEGQYLQLPKGFKNGSYILEIEIDPKHRFYESNRSNNTFSMPIEIHLQN